MKTIFFILCLWLSTFWSSAVAQNQPLARGCVVHKGASHATASTDEYTAYQRSGPTFTVADVAGNLIAIFPTENPIFLPYPSDPAATWVLARAQIERARKAYPECGRRLAVIEKAWAADPRAKVASIPAPPVSRPAPPDKKPKGMEIVTTSGMKYLNVTITSIDPDGLSVRDAGGAAKILFTDLSAELRSKYGYDPKKAAEFSQMAQLAAAQKAGAGRQQGEALAQANAPKYRVFMKIRSKAQGGFLLEAMDATNEQSLAERLNREGLKKMLAYWNSIPEDQRHDAADDSKGGIFLRGYPSEERLADGDTVLCLSVADGIVSIDGSTYHALRWIPLPLPQ